MELYEKVSNRLLSTGRENIHILIDYMVNKTDYFTAPASTQYHNNFLGGLALHSDNVVELLIDINRSCNLNLTTNSIYIAGYLHDLCKTNIYKKTLKKFFNEKNKLWQAYETYCIEDDFPLGHGEKSLAIALRFIRMTDEECLMIRWHMGSSLPIEQQKTLKLAQEMYKGVQAINLADIEASKFMEKTLEPKIYTMVQYEKFLRGELKLE